MKAAIEALERELRVADMWTNPAAAEKIKKEIERAIDILKLVEATDATVVPRKKPKWV